jgi:hypothetical protein
MISSRGMADGKSHHELSTVAARVDSSDNEWRILDTVSPPRENARSTSVDVAVQKNVDESKDVIRAFEAYLGQRGNPKTYVPADGQFAPWQSTMTNRHQQW